MRRSARGEGAATLEARDPATAGGLALDAGVERMALGAHVDADVALRRADAMLGATRGARDGGQVVSGMNVSLHGSSSSGRPLPPLMTTSLGAALFLRPCRGRRRSRSRRCRRA